MPPLPSDNLGLERLRRKFAEQNHVIIKSNTRQAMVIQKLHTDAAKLISENLTLRNEIIRLEKELQDSSARRIADHALEIKNQVQEQLLELSATLARLGMEPPKKRHSSPSRCRTTHPRRSLSATSPPRKRSRDHPQDSEALAIRENRLPPIQENKSYPRATLSAEEIRALCEEAADTDATNSPDLGPPPVSRYVDDDAEAASPSTHVAEKFDKTVEPPRRESSPALEKKVQPSPKPSPQKEERTQERAPARVSTEGKLDKENVLTAPGLQLSRIGKRKFGDEPEAKTVKTFASVQKAEKASRPKTTSSRGTSKLRSIKDLSAPGTTRKALSVKSSNQDLSSPIKVGKPEKPEKVTSLNSLMLSTPSAENNTPAKENTQNPASRTIARIQIPEPEPPAVATILPEHNLLSPLSPLTIPGTPDRAMSEGTGKDTPPPADISINGETIRPSRRARAAISYAEPNLRDKMRRPTKQMLDAVAGEGKFVQRPHKGDEMGSSVRHDSGVPSSADSRGAYSVESRANDLIMAIREAPTSPLAERSVPSVSVSTSTVERQKRPSITTYEPGIGIERSEEARPIPKEEKVKLTIQAAKENRRKSSLGTDVYDFSSSSPLTESSARPEPAESKGRTTARPGRRASAAAAAAVTKIMLDEPSETTAKPKAPHPRKRASMVEPDKLATMLESTDDDSTVDPRDLSSESLTNDRISRRRSMML